MSAQFRAADPHFRASSFVRPTPPTPTGPPPQLFIGNWSSNRCRSPSPANGLSDGKQYLLSHHPSCVPHPRALHSRHPMGDESLISGGHHSNRHGILIGIINSLSFPSVCVCVSQPFRLGKIAEMETANDQSDSRFASRDRYLVLGKESACFVLQWSEMRGRWETNQIRRFASRDRKTNLWLMLLVEIELRDSIRTIFRNEMNW